MSQFEQFIKFTEMLSDAERACIEHLSSLDKRILYFLEKSKKEGCCFPLRN